MAQSSLCFRCSEFARKKHGVGQWDNFYSERGGKWMNIATNVAIGEKEKAARQNRNREDRDSPVASASRTRSLEEPWLLLIGRFAICEDVHERTTKGMVATRHNTQARELFGKSYSPLIATLIRSPDPRRRTEKSVSPPVWAED
jgi:hypothetical protein